MTAQHDSRVGPTPSAAADHRLEIAIGWMLRIGVSIAAGVILVGGLLYLVHGNVQAPNYRHFHSAPQEALSIRGTLTGVVHGSSLSIIQLGVLLLIATPIVRVAFALVGFLREGDRLYGLVSAVVLAILSFSLLHGH